MRSSQNPQETLPGGENVRPAGATSAERLPKIPCSRLCSPSDCRGRVLAGGEWECVQHESRRFKRSSCGCTQMSAAGTGLPTAGRRRSGARALTLPRLRGAQAGSVLTVKLRRGRDQARLSRKAALGPRRRSCWGL